MRAREDTTVPYREFVKQYDDCVSERLSALSSRFMSFYYVLQFAALIGSTVASAAQAPTLAGADIDPRILALVTVATGLFSSVLIAIVHISKVNLAAASCKESASLISYHVALRKPVPREVYMRISETNTLCFTMGQACVTSA